LRQRSLIVSLGIGADAARRLALLVWWMPIAAWSGLIRRGLMARAFLLISSLAR
jgi:hypothetical protein